MNKDGYSYDALMKEAMNILEKLAGEAWTDFNIHDPGITILEYLAFALHDVSFRISLPIADHVASVIGKDGLRSYLPLPEKFLHCRPITDDDLRAILIDLPYVNNAWIDHEEAGLRNLIIDCSPNLSSNQKVWLRQAAREIFIRWRVLGTDVGAIRFIRPSPIQVRLTVNVPTNCDLDAITKHIVLILEKHIRRMPKYEDITVSNPVFTSGPPLTNGQLTETTLLNSRRSNRLKISPIREEIEALEDGVILQNIYLSRDKNIHSGLNGLPLDPKKIYELDLDSLAITIRENGLAKTIDLTGVRKWIDFHRDKQSKDKHMKYLPLPEGGEVRHDLADYSTVQAEFPAIYCLTKGSVPPSFDEEKKGKAKQLQGFITLLEQFIAMAITRMKGSAALLNMNSTEFAFDAGEISGLSLHEGMENSDNVLFLKTQNLLKKATEKKLACDQWEQFSMSLYGEHSAYIGTDDIHNKGMECFEGWNYICPAGDGSRLTWIERTIADAFMTSNNGSGSTFISIEDFSKGSNKLHQFFLLNKLGEKILHSTMVYETYQQASHAADKILRNAASRHRYSIQSKRNEQGEITYKLCLQSRDSYENLAVSQTLYTQISNAERDRDTLIESATRALSQRGIYMIDHILLRPAQNKLPLACQHQITFIMPNDSKKWLSPFSQDTVISALDDMLPAHLLANIIWLDSDKISVFEVIYGAWLDDFWGGGPYLENSRQTVISFLEKAGIAGWTISETDDDKEGADYENNL